MQAVPVNTLLLAATLATGAALPAAAQAQAAGEHAETGPAATARASLPPRPRTGLWHDVQTHRHQPSDTTPVSLRLTAEQRLQLRQQIREQMHEPARAPQVAAPPASADAQAAVLVP
ncbi:MAG: hypothetical protein Q4G71_07570 [Pseudomonadota bacterium]|nr:hypothetical protein [Pseudomonadota bacterium]